MNNTEMVEKNSLAEDLLEKALMESVEIKGNPMMLLTNPKKRESLAGVLNLAFEAIHAKNEVINELLSRELAREGEANE